MSDKIIYTKNVDYQCDRCGNKESVCESLHTGRLSNGHDYQLCNECYHEGVKLLKEMYCI